MSLLELLKAINALHAMHLIIVQFLKLMSCFANYFQYENEMKQVKAQVKRFNFVASACMLLTAVSNAL